MKNTRNYELLNTLGREVFSILALSEVKLIRDYYGRSYQTL
jgi:hypothetical protein